MSDKQLDEVVADTIAQFEGSGILSKQAYNTLRDDASRYNTSAEFFDHLKGGERQRVADKFGSEPALFKKDGTLKWNGFMVEEWYAVDKGWDYTLRRGKAFIHTLPGAYKTAKSVLGRALDSDLDITGAGKTDLEKRMSVSKNDFEKAVEYARRLHKLKYTLSSSEWYDVEVIING